MHELSNRARSALGQNLYRDLDGRAWVSLVVFAGEQRDLFRGIESNTWVPCPWSLYGGMQRVEWFQKVPIEVSN